MNRSALMLTLVLAAPQLCAGDEWSEGWYPDRPAHAPDSNRRYIDSYGDPYIPADELAARQRGTDRRVVEPYQPPRRTWREPSADPYDWGYPGPGAGGLSEYRGAQPYSGAGRDPRDLPPREGAEYRFRGDQALGAPAWAFGPERQGYRFRPLTDAERDRIRGESQWWSGAALEPPGLVQPQAPSFGGGALGYEPDSWFGRHYGDRP